MKYLKADINYLCNELRKHSTKFEYCRMFHYIVQNGYVDVLTRLPLANRRYVPSKEDIYICGNLKAV